jgi:hypothetical protein
MTRSAILVAFALALCACGDVRDAQSADQPDVASDTSLYDDSTLAYWQGRYEPNIRYNLDSLILPALSSSERRAVRMLSLQLPLRDEYDPLAYYVPRQSSTIVMSILSIKFMDDLAIASVWLVKNDYSIESIAYYCDVVKYRNAASGDGDFYKDPLSALGIPADALADKWVDETSQNVLKSAVVFILAHEIGHVIGGHSPDASVELRQQHEMEADRFAVRIFRQIGVAPIGAVPFFLTATHLAPHRGDFDTDSAWKSWQLTEASHPLSGQRLSALASQLRVAPRNFTRYDKNPDAAVRTILAASDQIDSIGLLLDDKDLQRHASIVGRRIPLSELRPRRPGKTWLPDD